MGKTPVPNTLFVAAGEASGDLLAAAVVRRLKRRNPGLRVFGLGGPALSAAGADVREDLTKQALIGFTEVVKHLPQVLARLSQCDRWLEAERPDAVLLVDYPGFNLRVAAKARRLGIPVCYYVAPQLWAWHESRIHALRRDVSRLMVLYPFEEGWFRDRGMDARYVGHPLASRVPRGRPAPMGKAPLVCVMPGSRRGELERIWPVMLGAARLLLREYPKARFAVPRPPSVPADAFPGLSPGDPFRFVAPDDYRARGACHFAWVKSGTSTLETALLGTPMALVYRVSPLSFALAKALVKVRHVGLVNLLSERPVVTELLQGDANPVRLAAETLSVLRSKERLREQADCFTALRRRLSKPRDAVGAAARVVGELLQGPPRRRADFRGNPIAFSDAEV
jgi:lipid-A-disaccharide synthase